MTTALAFDLFLVEDEMIIENELVSIINGNHRRNNLLVNLLVIENENPEIKVENGNPKNENLKCKGLFDVFGNENPENEIKKVKGSNGNSENGNPKIKMFLHKARNPENEVLDLEKIHRDMVKGYMKLLS